MLPSNKIDDLVEFNFALIGNYVSFHYDTPPLVNLNFDKKACIIRCTVYGSCNPSIIIFLLYYKTHS